MASKQTRRSISVRGTTYAALRDYCEGHDRSMSDVVEELLAGVIDSKPAAKKTVAHYVARVSSSPKEVTPKDEVAIRTVSEPKLPIVQPKQQLAAAPKPAAVKPTLLKPPVAAKAMGPGRPAPTPADKVIAPRQEKAMPKNDYRSINF
jgi:hypothetical protein